MTPAATHTRTTLTIVALYSSAFDRSMRSFASPRYALPQRPVLVCEYPTHQRDHVGPFPDVHVDVDLASLLHHTLSFSFFVVRVSNDVPQ